MKDKMRDEIIRIQRDVYILLKGSLVENKLDRNEVESLLRDILNMCDKLLKKDSIMEEVGEEIKKLFEKK